MSNKLMQVGMSANTNYEFYFIEEKADLDKLPKIFGTMAYDIHANSGYVCDSQGEWCEIK